jgi:hypothetical protein
MTPSRKAKLSALPTKSARLIRPSGTIHVYEAVIWGVRHCQREGLPMDLPLMAGYAQVSLDLLRDVCAAYAWRERRKALAR